MKQNVGVAVVLLLLIELCCTSVQAAPHMSAEDSDESTSSAEPDSDSDSVGHVTPVELASREMMVENTAVASAAARPDEVDRATVLDTRSSEEARDPDDSDEDDAAVQFPKAGAGHCPMCPKGPAATDKKTESLCPARPEEITKIEAECAEEYRQWKEMRARKIEQATTTSDNPAPIHLVVEPTNLAPDSIVISSIEDLQMTTLDMTTMDTTMTTDTMMDMTTDDNMTTEDTTVGMSTTTSTFPTTTRPIRRKHKRSRKIVKKKSCYPATCILRKLNLLDSMGQPSISRIQSFAVNMTVGNSKSLEEKAVGCVKEINEAMIDASSDIGKKVGCVAQKVITCLNKGLTCPIMKVSQ